MRRAELASAAGAARFLWPTPPYYEMQQRGSSEGEAALVVFRDGTKATGTLHEFSPDDMLIGFQQTNADASLKLQFSELLLVELLRPAALRREKLPEDVEKTLSPASDKQPFTIDLANGKKHQGETVGFVEALCGLFLFIPEGDGRVLRQFVPSATIRSYKIGKPIGQLFVEENAASVDAVDAALEKQANLRSRRLGEYLVQSQIVSPEQLEAALKQQRAQPVQKLGDALVELGYISPAELQEALAIEERNRTIPLGEILTEMGAVEAEVVNGVMAKKLGIPFVDLRAFDVAQKVLERIPAAIAHRYQVLPLAESESGLVVATDNPMNMGKMDELRFIVGQKLIAVMAAAADIHQALEKSYGRAVASAPRTGSKAKSRRQAPLPRGRNGELGLKELTARLEAESGELDSDEQEAIDSDATLVQLVNKVISDAIRQKASDIHIETNSGERQMRVRLRKDGVLLNYLELPAKFRKPVISRVKIMSQLDITEKRKPQDGKIDFGRFGDVPAELRVATIPTANGLEDVVIRVLSDIRLRTMDELGLDPANLRAIKTMMARPHGLFLVCGPTGSGKTTTLHSLLAFLNTPEVKIWTAEDPIEIVQPGLRQVQLNPKIGWSFAQAMRAFMRGDPDVIMVGEMRDAETAKAAIEASLTGHLVLSTLHTNSAAESVVRLLDLGMDPFNFADALLGVLAERLVRELCEHCREPYQPDAAELGELAMQYCGGASPGPAATLEDWRARAGRDGIVLYRAKGCERCDGSGYKGRLAVYELLGADPALKRLVQTRAPIPEISAAAIAGGMRLLRQDCIARILEGRTDIRQLTTI